MPDVALLNFRAQDIGFQQTALLVMTVTKRLAACRALVVEAKTRLREDRFLAICESIVVLWIKNRRNASQQRSWSNIYYAVGFAGRPTEVLQTPGYVLPAAPLE